MIGLTGAPKALALMTWIATAVLMWMSVRASAAEAEAGVAPRALPSAEEIAKLPADGGKEFNRLIHEKSPYLLQHARNPVDWYPWGPEAFAKAKKENKPIFLSVGYSTCHWCHVMEHESFERQDVADILNAHFVAIKVDREERPDVDQIYMLVTQLMTGQGGWPNSVWLTPERKPWFAGTYFPREDKFGRPGFKKILTSLALAWRQQRKEIDTQSERIAQAMKKHSMPASVAPGKLSHELLAGAVRALAPEYDDEYGGFGRAPKFPPHGALRLLLAEYARTKDAGALKLATGTLDAMARGGMYDQVGGGFHRYSTDRRWFLPHFEKMLYDNAQLARVYVDAYVLTRDEAYRRTAGETYDWVLREMADPAGGFHSALDADSEGEEGKFYLWGRGEVLKVLGKAEGELFCDVYGVKAEGNFVEEATGKGPRTNIPYLRESVEDSARRLKIPADELLQRLKAAREKLLAVRVQRVWPHRDDKVLASWNALMIGSLAHGGKRLAQPRYTAAAERAADFVLTRMRKDGRLLRTYRAGSAKLNAYLDDYAFLADALMDLYETTGKPRWLAEARALVDTMDKYYKDPAGPGYYFTASDHEDLLVRTKDPMDSALPAGNAVAASALVRLGAAARETKYLTAGRDLLAAFGVFMERVPRGTAYMLVATGRYLEVAPAAAAGPRPDATSEKRPVTVEAFLARPQAAAGETVEVKLRLTVDPGWHVQSHRPGRKDLIATAVGLKKGSPASLGEVAYPPGKNVKLALSEEAMSLYAGTVEIRAPLALAKDAKPGKTKFVLTVTTQACNDSACQTAQTHELPLTMTVTK